MSEKKNLPNSISIDPDIFLKVFVGTWYQIAGSKFYWTNGCFGSVAIYDQLDLEKKEFTVTNYCLRQEKKSKKIKQASFSVGKGHLMSCSKANFMIEFPQIPPFITKLQKNQGGNFFIIDCIPDIYAVVVTKNYKTIWILARSRDFSKTTKFQELLEKYNHDPKLKNKKIIVNEIISDDQLKTISYHE